MKITSLLLFVLLGLLACNPPSKLAESGNYDQAINQAISKLRGKKKKKAEHVAALEKAFKKATQRDMAEAESLKKEGQEENWVRVYKLYLAIKTRQRKIEPLLPLYDENGKKAEFKFVRVEELERESKSKVVSFYYDHARDLLEEAEKGNRFAAREAYDELKRIDEFYEDYRDKDELKEIARELGTTHVLFKMENNTNQIIPEGFEDEIRRMSVADLGSTWKKFYSNPKAKRDFDYLVLMNLLDMDVSRESEKEREYVDDKEIEDGFQYVLDENGNVMKDTAGNDIKVAKVKIIKATVFEIYQHKAARVGGRLEYFNNKTRDIIKTDPVGVEAVFENYASRFEGDERALTEESKKRIGNKPVPFPSDEILLMDAANKLKSAIRRQIKNFKGIK